MEGTCGRALASVLSRKVWFKLFYYTSSEFQPMDSMMPNEKRGNCAHIDSTAPCPGRILTLYVLEFDWPTINSLRTNRGISGIIKSKGYVRKNGVRTLSHYMSMVPSATDDFESSSGILPGWFCSK